MDRMRIAPLAGALAMAWIGAASMGWAAPGGGARGIEAPGTPPCGHAAGDPCPLGIERPCAQAPDPDGHGPMGPTPFCDCACGTGFWALDIADSQVRPARPVWDGRDAERINGTWWSWHRECEAQPYYAEAHVTASGGSEFWHAASITKAANARFATTERDRWVGDGIPCPRLVQLAAVGGGMLEIALTCSAQAGCAATASASLAGSCSSRGDAGAMLDGKGVDGNVAYRSLSRTSSIEGRFGTSVDDSSVGIDGKISQQAKWEVTGAGTASGTATYTVKADRTYCAFTNRPIARTANGFAVAVGGATVDWNGTAGFEAMAVVAMRVQ